MWVLIVSGEQRKGRTLSVQLRGQCLEEVSPASGFYPLDKGVLAPEEWRVRESDGLVIWLKL